MWLTRKQSNIEPSPVETVSSPSLRLPCAGGALLGKPSVLTGNVSDPGYTGVLAVLAGMGSPVIAEVSGVGPSAVMNFLIKETKSFQDLLSNRDLSVRTETPSLVNSSEVSEDNALQVVLYE